MGVLEDTGLAPEDTDKREEADNEPAPEVSEAPDGSSIWDLTPSGFGDGNLDKNPEPGEDYAEGQNIQADLGGADPNVEALQRILVKELGLDEDNPTKWGNSSALPDFGIDGVWRCETQKAFSDLLKKKGIDCDDKSPSDCGEGVSNCGLDEDILKALKEKEKEEEEEKDKEKAKEEASEKSSRKVLSDQCILMGNISEILSKSKPPTTTPPYHDATGGIPGRRSEIKYKNIHKITTNDPSTLFNRLRMTRGALEFLNIRHWELSQLVPTIRIYKLYPQEEPQKEPREVEMKFNSFIDPITDLQEMLNSQIQRGVGVGIESLNWEYIGTNQDTAKRDVRGRLVIYAQNFNELFKTRSGIDQHGIEFVGGYRIIDLVLQSLGSVGRPNDPNNYSIKIVVGWAATGGGGILSPDLVSGLKDMQLTMILTVGDYDIDIQDEQGGAVRILLDFYPRMEAIMLGSDSDVLSDADTRKRRLERRRLVEALTTQTRELSPDEQKQTIVGVANEGGTVGPCLKPEQIIKLQEKYREGIQKEIENSAQSFLRDLLMTGSIYTAIITQEDVNDSADPETEAAKAGEATGAAAEIGLPIQLEVFNPKCEEERLENIYDLVLKPGARSVNYFFLGDLLALAINNVLDKPEMHSVYYGNIKYMLGPIEIPDPNPEKNGTIFFNIADVPISVELFSDFMRRKISHHMETGISYPLYKFTREVIKELAFEAMGPDCYGGTRRLSVNLETAQISADPASGGIDPITAKMTASQSKSKKARKKSGSENAPSPETVLDIDQFEVDFENPSNSTFVFDSFNKSSMAEKYNYFVIYATGESSSKLMYPDGSKYKSRHDRDFVRGIYHITTGLDRGLTKGITFSKQQISPHVKSARIMQNRNMPDVQMANVFQLAVRMFGNNLFFPASMIYINTRGLGSDLMGDAGVRDTPANILGLGGYHMVGTINNKIDLNGYSTTVNALWSPSGLSSPAASRTVVNHKEIVGKEIIDSCSSFEDAMKKLS